MTQIARDQTPGGKLREALAALKRAATARHRLDEGTPEYRRALELEVRLTHAVYDLASAIEVETPDGGSAVPETA